MHYVAEDKGIDQEANEEHHCQGCAYFIGGVSAAVNVDVTGAWEYALGIVNISLCVIYCRLS